MAAHAAMTRYGYCSRTTARYSELRNVTVHFVLIILYSLYFEYDSLLLPSASGLAGSMAELRSYYPLPPSDKRKRKAKHLKVIYVNYKGNVMKSERARRLLLLLLLLRTFGWEPPDIGSYQEVHHRLIALLHGE